MFSWGKFPVLKPQLTSFSLSKKNKIKTKLARRILSSIVHYFVGGGFVMLVFKLYDSISLCFYFANVNQAS